MIIKRAPIITFLLFCLIPFSTFADNDVGDENLTDNLYNLIRKARDYSENGEYDSSLALSNRALELTDGKKNIPDTTMAGLLNVLALSYYNVGEYGVADSIYSNALKIKEESGIRDDSLLADILGNMAKLYIMTERNSEAMKLLERSLKVRESVFGENHLEVAKSLSLMGVVHYFLSNYQEALKYQNRTLEIRTELLGPDHYDVGMTLNNLATIYEDMGRYREAESLYTRSLSVHEKVFGESHPNILSILYNLALLETKMGRYKESDSLNRRVLQIAEETIGLDHPLVAMVMDVFALNNKQLGRYSLAIPYHQKALAIREKCFGENSSDVALSLSNIGMLYADMGQLDLALEYLNRSRKIKEDDPDVSPLRKASCYGFLGIVHNQMGNYDSALVYEKKCLEMQSDLLGLEHPLVTGTIHNLAEIYDNLGEYKTAESLYVLTIDIRKKIMGPDYIGLAQGLNNLAHIYYEHGHYDKAEKLLMEALDIYDDDPDRAACIHGLARLYAATEQYDKSLKFYKDFLDIRQEFIQYTMSFSSEEQKLRWIDKYSPIEPSLYTMAMVSDNADAKKLALDMVLKSKSLVIDAIMTEDETAYCEYNKEITDKLRARGEVCTKIANLVMVDMAGELDEIYRDSIKVLRELQDSLEVEISQLCSEFKKDIETGGITVEEVAQALPKDAMLWEFMKYDPYDFKKLGNNNDKTGDPRYLAITLRHSGDINIIDLGGAKVIDSLVGLSRNIIYDSDTKAYSPVIVQFEAELNSVTSKLYDILYKPLEDKSGGITKIYLSPDGSLNLIPFEILPDTDSTYVIEHYKLCYLTSGRDLLRFDDDLPAASDVIIVADPDFNSNGHEKKMLGNDDISEKSQIASLLISEPMRGDINCLKNPFNPLRYGKEETDLISRSFENQEGVKVVEYYGSDAREDVIKHMNHPPRLLHISTHGFYCTEKTNDDAKSNVNPLLRSGMVLAGANNLIKGNKNVNSDGDDGILTAFEVSRINLVGTELATLSACETGVGETSDGQGIFGLRRAFQHTGVKSILMSLWKVPDKETAELMEGFYTRWFHGKSKRDALRESALEILNRVRNERGTGHPILWGGFVLSGNPN